MAYHYGKRVAVFFLMLPAAALAAEGGQQSAASAIEPAASAAAAAKPLTPEEQIRAQLDGTQWTVQLNPSSGSKGLAAQKDTISFTSKQVSSQFLSKAGYPASNYSLSIGGDGRAVWETMQTKEGEGVAFWRGELEGSTMQGVLSRHPTEGNPEDYSISGQAAGDKKITIPAAAVSVGAVKVAPAQPAAPAAEAAPDKGKAPAKQPAAAKKKRKWF